MPPPPLLGYNNNVRHRGRIFHIQTEDSGIGSPRIKTHLFADGGRIVKSTRTDYTEHLGHPDMVEIVKNLMKEQHKAMFVALRSGQLDELIGFEPDAPPATAAGSPVSASAESLVASTPTPTSQGSATKSRPEPAPPTPRSAAGASSRKKAESSPSPAARSASSGASNAAAPPAAASSAAANPPASSGEGDGSADRPYAAPRPAAIFSVPPSGSIFGDVGLDEKSLDDAILSYLAEDPKKEDPKKKE